MGIESPTSRPYLERTAREDFSRAARKAFWRKVTAWIKGESNQLLSYDDVRSAIPIRGQRYLGLQSVPLDQIVGSVGRYRDFDRIFGPTQTRTADRWIRLDVARSQDIHLPPVDLYKIGEAYFVKDGNHRISVARERGQEHIDAFITEISVPVPFSADVTPDALPIKRENAWLMEETGLQTIRPGAELQVSLAGECSRIVEHIRTHQYYLSSASKKEIDFSAAVGSWYDTVYLPLAASIRESGLQDKFPERTEADLYLMVSEYQWMLRQAYEKNQTLQVVLDSYAENFKDWPIRPVLRELSNAHWVDRLILEQEQEDFHRQTGLSDGQIQLTLPGKYEKIVEHIRVHRWYLGEEQGEEVSFPEAAAAWYRDFYLPLAAIIREQDVISYFPERTESDLVLWILERREQLSEELGWEITPEQTLQDIVPGEDPEPGAIGPLHEILVAVGHEPENWRAFEQAVLVVKRTGGRLHGLHVLDEGAGLEDGAAEELKQRFEAGCRQAQVDGELAVVHGKPARVINERARWVELVILPLNHPPERAGLFGIGSGFRGIIRRAGRPILALPQDPSQLDHILLAFDGSQKAWESLFLAQKMAAIWETQLEILSVDEGQPLVSAELFLGQADLNVGYHFEEGDVAESILETARQQNCNLIMMGGYGLNAVIELVLGSSVDQVLARSPVPILISP